MATSPLLAKIQSRLNAAKELAEEARKETGLPTAPVKNKETATRANVNSSSGASNLLQRLNNLNRKAIQAKEDTFVMPGKVVTGISEVIKQMGDRQSIGMDGKIIELNDQQYDVCQIVASGENVVVIGPAGSGKSTTQRAAALRLMNSGRVPVIKSTLGHKWLTANRPGIIVCSYTRRAVNNIRKILPADLQANCMTIHRLLEFMPTDVESDELDSKGNVKSSRLFLPHRTRVNPLSSDIHTIIIEEAGMVSVELHQMLMDALPHKVQFVYLGDIYQLPPPMGSAILGYKMNEHRVVSLDRVYRTGQDSPILELAHRIKDGRFIKAVPMKDKASVNPRYPVLDKFAEDTNGIVTIRPWRRRLDPRTVNVAIKSEIVKYMADGTYDPEQDVILCPYEKELSDSTKEELVSTININKQIANHLGKQRGAEVVEIIAGQNKQYFAAGDKVMFDKMDMEIVSIERNVKYLGQNVRAPSKDLDRWGHVTGGAKLDYDMVDEADQVRALASIEDIFDMDIDDISNQASHVIKMRHLSLDVESGEEKELIEISKTGDVNNLLFGYALTVYKSQGSEWRNVIIVLHHTHARHTSNEMLYTAVTRAKNKLIVFCEPETFENGIKNRVIKGKTLQEKAEFFKDKKSRAAASSGLGGLKKFVERKIAQDMEKGEAAADFLSEEV